MIPIKLTPDTACTILQNLLDTGKITSEDISSMISHNIPTELKRLVTLVHRIFCDKEHSFQGDLDEYSNYCLFNQEESDPRCWQLPDHEYWTKQTIALLDELGISTETEFLSLFNASDKLRHQMAELEVSNPLAYLFALKVKNLVPFLDEAKEED